MIISVHLCNIQLKVDSGESERTPRDVSKELKL